VSDISPSPVSKNLRFLLVDDTLSILKVVGRALLNKKYIVETAENGFLALNMLIDGYAARHYDVVLMDFQMPVMDGIEAVRRYREYEKNRSTLSRVSSPRSDESTTLSAEYPRRSLLIIGMSANSDNAIVKDALDVGMDAFMPKPFTMFELQAVLDAKHPFCIEARSPLRMSAS
jgi:CheY-like chemotaxis protein